MENRGVITGKITQIQQKHTKTNKEGMAFLVTTQDEKSDREYNYSLFTTNEDLMKVLSFIEQENSVNEYRIEVIIYSYTNHTQTSTWHNVSLFPLKIEARGN